MTYTDFLQRKTTTTQNHGRPAKPGDTHPMLHPWQAEIVAWAVRTGRAAIWADTGMGKTVMQLEWARMSGDTTLIVAPLAVCHQTTREAAKLGITAHYIRNSTDITGPGVWVTNYEMIEHFDPSILNAVVLDEASILKNSDGKTRARLIRHFTNVPARLACTATPAPNDPEELTNQAEFLGQATRVNMLATYFVHDSDGWRLKGHARGPMFHWMASWAVAIRRPSDMGYDDDGYVLPGLDIVPHLVDTKVEAEGQLFATDLGGVGGRAKIRRSTLTARCDRAVQLVYDCGSQGIQPGLLQSKPRKVEADSGGKRAEERGEAQEVRRGCIPSRGIESIERGIQEAASAATPGQRVRTGSAHCGDDDRSWVRNMPREPTRGSESQDAHRSRPRNGHGPRCSLSAVQSSTWTSERRSDSRDGDVRLPHACVDQWVIWCGLNDEQARLARSLGEDCRSIDGRTPVEDRVRINDEWIRGDFRVLLVKPGMYSQGMNWQHCARMAFVGLSDSYEAYYQSIRRCYRYGQPRIVEAHIVLSELEQQIASNVARKENEATSLIESLVTAMNEKRNLA